MNMNPGVFSVSHDVHSLYQKVMLICGAVQINVFRLTHG